MLLFVLSYFGTTFTWDSFVKLLRQLQKFLQKKAFMVECSRLIVNDCQIKVNDYFLNFQIISIGKIRNN
jgi:hypothetical protein